MASCCPQTAGVTAYYAVYWWCWTEDWFPLKLSHFFAGDGQTVAAPGLNDTRLELHANPAVLKLQTLLLIGNFRKRKLGCYWCKGILSKQADPKERQLWEQEIVCSSSRMGTSTCKYWLRMGDGLSSRWATRSHRPMSRWFLQLTVGLF